MTKTKILCGAQNSAGFTLRCQTQLPLPKELAHWLEGGEWEKAQIHSYSPTRNKPMVVASKTECDPLENAQTTASYKLHTFHKHVGYILSTPD